MKNNPSSNAVLLLLLGIFHTLCHLSEVQGQCSVPSTCLDLGDPQEYTLIESSVSNPLTFSMLIGSGKLLDPTMSPNIPQHLIICGPIMMNSIQYTFAVGSEIIFVDNNSGITVNVNCKLEFKGTHIHGCSQLWRSLLVFGRLDLLEGSKVEDAITAVQASEGSTFVSSQSEYDGNYICIYAGASDNAVPPSGSVSLAGFTISGSTFVGAKPLLQSYTPSGTTEVYTAPNTGILSENVVAIQVGSDGSATNTFRDFQAPNNGSLPVRGIRAIKSNLTVQKCVFRNIGQSDGSSIGFGVSGITTTGAHRITVNGLGGTSGSPVTFENVYTAVSVESTRLFVSNCRVVGCNTGIFERRATGSHFGAFQIYIHHNRIENACLQGIRLVNTMPSKSVIIADNWIAFNNTDQLCQAERQGITIRNIGQAGQPPLAPAGSYSIVRNRIRNEASFTSASGLKGITLINVIGVTVEENIIEDVNSVGTALAFKGIDLDHAPYTKLINNNIDGNKTNYALASAGISNLESNNTIMSCNHTDMIDQGVSFRGMACDATNFNFNAMLTHQEGLYLANNTIMGNQFEKNNIWAGSASQIEGKFVFPGYDPVNNPDDAIFVGRSFFFINTANEASSKWANPRLIDNNPDNDPVAGYKWFNGAGQQPGEILCAYGPRGLTNSDIKVIAGTLPPHRGYTSTVWEAYYHTYGRLLEDGNLRPTGSAALAWYNANYNANFAQLYRVEHDMDLLGLPSTATITAESALSNTLQLRDAKETEWVNATSTTLAAQKLQELLVLNTSVLSAQAAFNAAIAYDQAVAAVQKQLLLNTLAGLTLSEVYEQDLRAVLRSLLESDMGGIAFTTTQLADLDAIAAKCRLSGGYGVVLARSALGNLGEEHPIDETCGSENRGISVKAAKGKSFQASVSPNPSNGHLQIQWLEPVETASVSMHDLLGRIIHTWKVSGTSLSIDNLGSLPSGLYLLKIQGSDRKSETHKVLITN